MMEKKNATLMDEVILNCGGSDSGSSDSSCSCPGTARSQKTTIDEEGI